MAPGRHAKCARGLSVRWLAYMQASASYPDEGGDALGSLPLFSNLVPKDLPDQAPTSQGEHSAGSPAHAQVDGGSCGAITVPPNTSSKPCTSPSRVHSLPQPQLKQKLAEEPPPPLSGPPNTQSAERGSSGQGGGLRPSRLPSHLQLLTSPSLVDAPSVLFGPGSSTMGASLPSGLRVLGRSETGGYKGGKGGELGSSRSLAAMKEGRSLKDGSMGLREPASTSGRSSCTAPLPHVCVCVRMGMQLADPSIPCECVSLPQAAPTLTANHACQLSRCAELL